LFQKQKIRALSDEKLIESYKRENKNIYLGELFERYIRFVFLVCMKYLKNEELSKDMAMQVFEKLTEDLRRFEVKNFKSWLHVIVKNTCFMQLRSDKHLIDRSLNFENDAIKNMEINHELHPNGIDNHEIRLEQLQKALHALNADQKQCIELFYLKEKSYKDVADITGYTLNQVKSHIQNGKRNLKNYIILNSELLIILFATLYLKI
jgi:RNA polymerase sigma factor (sigma-70 family)